jgi:hypothetical protein
VSDRVRSGPDGGCGDGGTHEATHQTLIGGGLPITLNQTPALRGPGIGMTGTTDHGTPLICRAERSLGQGRSREIQVEIGGDEVSQRRATACYGESGGNDGVGKPAGDAEQIR